VTRDYRRAADKKNPVNKSTPGWLLFLAGLAIGLFTTLLVYLQSQSTHTVANTAANTVANNVTKSAPVVDIEADDSSEPKVKESVKKEEKPERTRPRFDFYTILPELEVLIPDVEILKKRLTAVTSTEKNSAKKESSTKNRDAQKNNAPSNKTRKKGKYVLQAGSFKSFNQAERRKAKLALLGAKAVVQRVTIKKNDVWYRVRIGPFNDLKKLNSVRSLLYKNNISAIALKVK